MGNTLIDWNRDWLVLSEDGLQCRAVTLLYGIRVDSDPIAYGPLTLKQYDQKKEPIFTEKDLMSSTQCAVLELKYVDQKDAKSMYMEPMEIVVKAFRTFQLLVDSWVGSSKTYYIDIKSGKEIGTSGSSSSALADTPDYCPEANLTTGSAPAKELFINIHKIQRAPFDSIMLSKSNTLGHVLERFSRACTEIKRESILDFVIALEGTLGFGSQSVSSHRIASRGALLLAAGDPSKRMDFYKTIKYLYRIRSAIVHEGGYSFPDKNFPKEHILSLGYTLDRWDEKNWYRMSLIADIARKITRDVLLRFVTDKTLLNEERLLKIELSI